MQEHVHPRQVEGGVIDFLTEEAVLNEVVISSELFRLLLRLEQKRARTRSGVVNLIHARLPMDSELGDRLGNMLGSEKLTARFPALAA